MYRLMSQEKLRNMLDRVTREITLRDTGIRLDPVAPGGDGPGESACTVYITFERGMVGTLCLCADADMLIRVAKVLVECDDPTFQDVEDVAKEYLNVLAGHVLIQLFPQEKKPARFSVPAFRRGSFAPEEEQLAMALDYASDQAERVRLAYYIPHGVENTWKEDVSVMKKKVMVVDDSRISEIKIRKLLEDTDYEVAAYCANGEDAIARYAEVQPDVVTMDIIMPGIDGLETAQVILEEHPEAKIIMVSSLAYEDTIDEADRIGAKGFLYKPLEREPFLEALEKALS